jgi:xylulokinase
MMSMAKRQFLGLDVSTQSLTALVVCPDQNQVLRYCLNFDRELPQYGTQGGVPPGKNPNEALVNPLMWVEAVDRMLLWCKAEGLSGNIAALSVSAQQHGSVYLNKIVQNRLKSLNPDKTFHDQLGDIFSRSVCPIWMDSSTSRECREITEILGRETIVSLTGSPATERFAGPQIRKFWKQHPAAYDDTVHITLISSFITALFIGRLAPLDCGDGLGTNLVELKSRNWSSDALDASAPGLGSKLPEVVKRDVAAGCVSDYLCRRYGFDPACRVIVGTGDNPASLVGLGLIGNEETRAISLGTSDTYFGYISKTPSHPRTTGHIFGTADGGLMFLLCFQNGSLARDAVRSQFNLDWDEFSEILLTTPPGNRGKLMLPYFMPEMTPVVLKPNVLRFGGLTKDDIPGNVRAVAEAQIMSMYIHSSWAGLKPKQILVTAGGSENKGLLKLIAQVFGTDVQAFEVRDSAALGAAVRAAGYWRCKQGESADLIKLSRDLSRATRSTGITANREDTAVYQGDRGLLKVYEACERCFFNEFSEFEERHQYFMEKYV